MISNHFATLKKVLRFVFLEIWKYLSVGDFNVGVNKNIMKSFYDTYEIWIVC